MGTDCRAVIDGSPAVLKKGGPFQAGFRGGELLVLVIRQ